MFEKFNFFYLKAMQKPRKLKYIIKYGRPCDCVSPTMLWECNLYSHLFTLNASAGSRCSWGRAVTVAERYIYASQPARDRVLVISVEQMVVVDVSYCLGSVNRDIAAFNNTSK